MFAKPLKEWTERSATVCMEGENPSHYIRLWVFSATNLCFHCSYDFIWTMQQPDTWSVLQVHCFCDIPDVLWLPTSHVPGISHSHCSRWAVLSSDTEYSADYVKSSFNKQCIFLYTLLKSAISQFVSKGVNFSHFLSNLILEPESLIGSHFQTHSMLNASYSDPQSPIIKCIQISTQVTYRVRAKQNIALTIVCPFNVIHRAVAENQ